MYVGLLGQKYDNSKQKPIDFIRFIESKLDSLIFDLTISEF